MKRFIHFLGILGILLFAGWVVEAMTPVYRGPLVNESALAYSNNYVVNASNIDYLSFQAVYSSATIPAISAVAAGVPFTKNSTVITSTNSFTLALPILYTQTGTAVGGLSTGTTYYVGAPAGQVALNKTFKLATSQANALAGSFITITSSTSSGSYNFAPLPYTGTPSFKFQVSNDGANWNDIAVSSVTILSPSNPPAISAWDIGLNDFSFVRASVVGPTTGGLNLVIWANGKNTSGSR